MWWTALDQHWNLILDIDSLEHYIALDRNLGVGVVAAGVLVMVEMEADRHWALLCQMNIPESDVPDAATVADVAVLRHCPGDSVGIGLGAGEVCGSLCGRVILLDLRSVRSVDSSL